MVIILDDEMLVFMKKMQLKLVAQIDGKEYTFKKGILWDRKS